MKNSTIESTSVTIQRKQLASLLSTLVGGNPNPDDTGPLGPGGPVIHGQRFFDPAPEPWRAVMLNPQPLPPRVAYAVGKANSAIRSVVASREVASLLPEPVRAQASDAVSRQLSVFIDDCGTVWPHWGIVPPPPPPPWWTELIGNAPSPTDLLVMGAQFTTMADRMKGDDLGRDLAKAGAQLMDLGLQRM